MIGTGSSVLDLLNGNSATLTSPNILGNDDPGLEPLGFYGGLTRTHRPQVSPASPVIDAGSNALAAAFEFDQRGENFPRVVAFLNSSNEIVDIGAVERQYNPRVKDVVLSYSDDSNFPARYVYSEVVRAGDQFRPAYHQGLDTIEIHFDSPVTLTNTAIVNNASGAFALKGKNEVEVPLHSYNYDSINYIAKWTFDPNTLDPNNTDFLELEGNKYAIHLTSSDVTGSNDQLLDGDWVNEHSGTFDNFDDDKKVSFPSGDGTEGSEKNVFRFHFSILPGDYNQDGIVTTADWEPGVEKDGDGDGDTDGDDITLAQGNVDDVLPFRSENADFEGLIPFAVVRNMYLKMTG